MITRAHLAGLELAREYVGDCNSETTAWDKCEGLDELIAQARTPAWNGEGLPPEGVECCVGHPNYKPAAEREWRKVRVLAHGVFRGTPVAICQDGDTILTAEASVFRPLRTAEELEREAAIVEMAQAAGLAGQPDVGTLDLLAALYDAGARMPGKGAKA